MFHTFKTEFLYHQRINNYEKINEYIIDKVEQMAGGEGVCWDLSKLKTTYFGGNNDFLRQDFILDEIIWNPLDNMMEEYTDQIPFGIDSPIHSLVNEIWYNVYREGEYQEIHNHQGPIKLIGDRYYHTNFSLIYLAELPPGGKNTTVFTKPQTIFGNLGSTRDNIDTGKIEDIGAGSVLIFPSHLDHYVIPFYGAGRRITVAANLITAYCS